MLQSGRRAPLTAPCACRPIFSTLIAASFAPRAVSRRAFTLRTVRRRPAMCCGATLRPVAACGARQTLVVRRCNRLLYHSSVHSAQCGVSPVTPENGAGYPFRWRRPILFAIVPLYSPSLLEHSSALCRGVHRESYGWNKHLAGGDWRGFHGVAGHLAGIAQRGCQAHGRCRSLPSRVPFKYHQPGCRYRLLRSGYIRGASAG